MSDLGAARFQMGMSLAFHIVFAVRFRSSSRPGHSSKWSRRHLAQPDIV